MHPSILLFSQFIMFLCGICSVNLFAQRPDWTSIKCGAGVKIHNVNASYNAPFMFSHNEIGWEDSPHISPDGRTLYAMYGDADMLSLFIDAFNEQNPQPCLICDYGAYQRGPTLGMNFITCPYACSPANNLIHGDILYTQRNTVTEAFPQWQQTAINTQLYTEAAPFPIMNPAGTGVDLFAVSIDNDPDLGNDNGRGNDIWFGTSVGFDLSGMTGLLPLPPNINSPIYNEDNPFIMADPQCSTCWVLFFDSNDRPLSNGIGGEHDLWYSETTDAGLTWTNPAPLSSLNSEHTESHAFVHFDGSEYTMYFTGIICYPGIAEPDCDHTAIYRSRHLGGNWNNWDEPELIIEPDLSRKVASVGEPSLTADGDICFAVVYDAGSTAPHYDRFDNDVWFLPHKLGAAANYRPIQPCAPKKPFSNLEIREEGDHLSVDGLGEEDAEVRIYSIEGRLLYQGKGNIDIQTRSWPCGIYIARIRSGDEWMEKKVMKMK